MTISKPIYLVYWLTIAILLLLVDFFSGPFIQFPISYLIPVALASWYNGRWWGLTLAVLMPLIRLWFNIDLWTVPWTMFEIIFNSIIKIAVLASFALIIEHNARQTHELNKEIQVLEGLRGPIPIHLRQGRFEYSVVRLRQEHLQRRRGYEILGR